MSKKRRLFAGITLFLFVVAFYYFFVTSSHISISTLKEKIEKNGDKYIRIEFENGQETTVSTPEIVWPFLKEGSVYFIKYRYNLMRSPFLEKIKEVES